MIRPTEVKSLGKYRIHVKFSDGVEGDLDLSHLAGTPVFKFWDEGNSFNKVYIDEISEAVSWNEKADIDLVNMYMKISGKNFDEINYYS